MPPKRDEADGDAALEGSAFFVGDEKRAAADVEDGGIALVGRRGRDREWRHAAVAVDRRAGDVMIRGSLCRAPHDDVTLAVAGDRRTRRTVVAGVRGEDG